jgi:nitrogen fixation protein FixH
VIGRVPITGSDVRYEVFHPKDGPVAADTLTLKFKRPVGERQDFELDLVPAAKGVFNATHEILPGHWIVDASAIRNGKRILHQAERIAVLRRAE